MPGLDREGYTIRTSEPGRSESNSDATCPRGWLTPDSCQDDHAFPTLPSPVSENDSPIDPGSATRSADNARRFGDDEVQKILEAAAELQERSGALGTGSARGLTIQELRQVAAEVGIDPHFVDIAATDVDAPMEKRGSAWMGGPDSWHFRTSVPGEIEDEEREQIVLALRSLMGQQGEIGEVFGRMEWTSNDGMGPVIIGVSSRDGATEIDMTANRAGEAGLYHGLGIPIGGVVGGAVLAASFGLSGPLVLTAIAGMSAASYGLTRLVWRKRSEQLERTYRRVMQRAASIVQEAARLPDGTSDAPRLPAPDEDA